MHSVTQRQKGSKIYYRNFHSIPFNKDKQHQNIDFDSDTLQKEIHQKKQIDTIMLGVVKQRMFGQFLAAQNRVSLQSYYTIDLLSKGFSDRRSNTKSYHNQLTMNKHSSKQFPYSSRKSSCNRHFTSDMFQSLPSHDKSAQDHSSKRTLTHIFPKLIHKKPNDKNNIKSKGQIYHHKKFKLSQKNQIQIFKKWVGGNVNNITVYQVKINRQNIISKFKNIIDSTLLQRFFHFFGFPQTFSLRQFCSTMQNAGNCSLKFIYFWTFALFDQNCNGVLQSQDLFRFLQKFASQNTYIESQVYQIQKFIKQKTKETINREEKELVEQILVMNHNLKADQLKILLKESEKQRIDVDCVKNTCYHQTLLSLQHDYLQRFKLSKIQNNEIESKMHKLQTQKIKKQLQTTPGLRLRDFYQIFNSKRPKIFCYFLNLLTGEKASEYE